MNIKFVSPPNPLGARPTNHLFRCRVRTLTGKEIELDIEPDYKVSLARLSLPPSLPKPGERQICRQMKSHDPLDSDI